MVKHNSIVVDGCVYSITPRYCDGAVARRAGLNLGSNPYPFNSADRLDWHNGYDHERLGEHSRFGLDVTSCAPKGRLFMDDPKVPRDSDGFVMSMRHDVPVVGCAELRMAA